MGSFGERLRREREMRGITLDEIAAATRIGSRSLKALEDEEFKKLPGGIFNKGFVRAYAKFLGISEEQAVSDYLAAVGEPEKDDVLDPVQMLARREDSETKSKAADMRIKELLSIRNDAPTGIPWMALLGLIVLVALAWGGRVGYVKFKAYRDEQAQAQREAQAKAQADAAAAQSAAAQQAAAQAAQPQTNSAVPPDSVSSQPATGTQPSSTPASTDSTTDSKQQPKSETTQKAVPADESKPSDRSAANPVQPGNFLVSIVIRQKAWVSIKVDGKFAMSAELPASSRRNFEAHDHVWLKTGNAGGTEVAFNGKPFPPLGADNEVRTVTINADGSLR